VPQIRVHHLACLHPKHTSIEHLLLLELVVSVAAAQCMNQAKRLLMNIAELEIFWTDSVNGEDLAEHPCGGPQMPLVISINAVFVLIGVCRRHVKYRREAALSLLAALHRVVTQLHAQVRLTA
jgi:hypothetical protein